MWLDDREDNKWEIVMQKQLSSSSSSSLTSQAQSWPWSPIRVVSDISTWRGSYDHVVCAFMPMASSPPTRTSAGPHYRSRSGDTTWTKVFVGGLAWETPSEELRRHFEPFGDILEAVVIADKATGRSKGYGFVWPDYISTFFFPSSSSSSSSSPQVTFREAEAAQRAVANANPVIDGRRANCNIAALARPRTSPRQQGVLVLCQIIS